MSYFKIPFSVRPRIGGLESLGIYELFWFTPFHVACLVTCRLLYKPLHSGQTRTPAPAARPLPVPKRLSASFRSRLARAMCWRRLPEPSVWVCVSVFTVPPSFSMSPTGKHSCVCLDFLGMCTRFFHVPQMMSMVYFLSRLPRWVQGTAPGGMLTFAPPHVS